MNLCVIPARGGSKRIPRKNIRPFAGKPIIAYAIRAAQKSELFSKIIVSTDDEEIAKVSQDFGAEVPFLRPPELADDYTPTVPVIAHAIRELESRGDRFGNVCCIYPCVPFLACENIKNALTLLQQGDADYSFPVCEYSSPIQRAFQLNKNGKISLFYPEYELARTQDLEKAYHDAGQFYWGSKAAWLKKPRAHSSALGLPISKQFVVDIDTPEDWIRAENLKMTFSK